MQNLHIVAGAILILLSTSCKKDEPADPIVPHEHELITTLKYTLTPDDGGETAQFTFQDIDGDGGDAPVVSGATLQSNTTYSGTLTLLNEAESPTEDITEEIEEEADEHQFFFLTSVGGLSIEYSDADDNGHPIGLASELTTTSEGTGTLTIILRHEPDKEAEGVSSGDLANAGGGTDIEVVFDVEVQ